ncbi:lipocalin family protein [Halobacteriovorax sp.]|uniref:lipocalin family protein n=1 Tax=Halobacteriovorax sp. TaxID=2020862 RepID=UPI0035630E56
MKQLFLMLLFASCTTLSANDLPLDTVNSVDLERYSGKWYEIARFEQKFQKNCTAVTATYRVRKDGDVDVTNTCRKHTPDGELKIAKAKAWVIDKDTNAKLKVQFFLRAIKLPFFAGNYWILDLGPDYEYAIIGDPSRKYLWFLSRTSSISEELYQELIDKAEDMSFDTSKLLKTIH